VTHSPCGRLLIKVKDNLGAGRGVIMRARPSRIGPAGGVTAVRSVAALVAVAFVLSPPPGAVADSFAVHVQSRVQDEATSPCVVLAGGDCVADGSDGAPYAGNSTSCTIEVLVPGTLNSPVFDTERGFDVSNSTTTSWVQMRVG